tara:strand:- start:165 stop:986 length:822 start_codon:yes stop_codon:yes gene_type:complete
MLHALGRSNYLRIENTNHVQFRCQFQENRRICVQEQFVDGAGQTQFDDIYGLKISEPTLRELMLIQSIYTAKTPTDVATLVAEQPTPRIFYKTFLELGCKSLLSFLAFDRRAIGCLLDDSKTRALDRTYPLIYKNPDGHSALDNALELNQLQSVSKMIDHMTKYQNDPVYAHLFRRNLVDLIKLSDNCAKLFRSKILNFEIQYFEWPSLNRDRAKAYAPYNNSMFKIRYEYRRLFPKLYAADAEQKLKMDRLREEQLSDEMGYSAEAGLERGT